MVATKACAEVFASHTGMKNKGVLTGMSSVYKTKQIGQNKVILRCFRSNPRNYDHINFSVISMGEVNEKCACTLTFIKVKNRL